MKDRIIIRIDKLKSFYEYGHPVIIFLDEPANYGRVFYASYTGSGEGDYHALIEQTRPITDEELKSYNGFIYGVNLNEFKIVKKRMKGAGIC